MNKEKIIRFVVGFFMYSVLYFSVGYFFKLPNMCYEDLKEWSCMQKSLGQTLFFGLFMMLLDMFVLKKFSTNKKSNNKD